MCAEHLEFPTQIDLVSFISHYAHDLRSPYNRIMGFSKIMLKGQSGPLTDFQKEDLTTVFQNGVYAYTLVSNLVDIARLIAGEKTPKPINTPIMPLIEQATTLWQRAHPDQNIEFDTRHLDVSPYLHVDETQFSQAVAALLACVIQYVQQPAKVIVSFNEEPTSLECNLQSQGEPAKTPSQIDIDMYGYIGQAMLQLNGGEFRRREILEDGAVITFMIPKKVDE